MIQSLVATVEDHLATTQVDQEEEIIRNTNLKIHGNSKSKKGDSGS
jgi:hypothetical protein